MGEMSVRPQGGWESGLADVNLRIELMRLREKASANEDWSLAAILDVAVRTVDGRLAETRKVETAVPLPTTLSCRNIRVKGARTSIRLEEAFWAALDMLARRAKCSINDLCDAAADLPGAGSLTAALRVYVLLSLCSSRPIP